VVYSEASNKGEALAEEIGQKIMDVIA